MQFNASPRQWSGVASPCLRAQRWNSCHWGSNPPSVPRPISQSMRLPLPHLWGPTCRAWPNYSVRVAIFSMISVSDIVYVRGVWYLRGSECVVCLSDGKADDKRVPWGPSVIVSWRLPSISLLQFLSHHFSVFKVLFYSLTCLNFKCVWISFSGFLDQNVVFLNRIR